MDQKQEKTDTIAEFTEQALEDLTALSKKIPKKLVALQMSIEESFIFENDPYTLEVLGVELRILETDTREERIAKIEGFIKELQDKTKDMEVIEPPETKEKVQEETRTKVKETIGVADILPDFEAQYETQVRVLEKCGLYDPKHLKAGDKLMPTPAEAGAVLAKIMTSEKREVIKMMEQPKLQLIPITSSARYLKALNQTKTMPRQIDANVSEWAKGAFMRADQRDGTTGDHIIGWQVAIMEGVSEPRVMSGEDPQSTLRERIALFEFEYGKKGVSGVTLKQMILLMIESLQNKQPINDFQSNGGTWTLVNEEPEFNNCVAGVNWDENNLRVYLFERRAERQYDLARLRPAVIGRCA